MIFFRKMEWATNNKTLTYGIFYSNLSKSISSSFTPQASWIWNGFQILGNGQVTLRGPHPLDKLFVLLVNGVCNGKGRACQVEEFSISMIGINDGNFEEVGETMSSSGKNVWMSFVMLKVFIGGLWLRIVRSGRNGDGISSDTIAANGVMAWQNTSMDVSLQFQE